MGGRMLGDERSTPWSPRTSKGPQADLSSREGLLGATLPLLPGPLLAIRGAGSAIYLSEQEARVTKEPRDSARVLSGEQGQLHPGNQRQVLLRV